MLFLPIKKAISELYLIHNEPHCPLNSEYLGLRFLKRIKFQFNRL